MIGGHKELWVTWGGKPSEQMADRLNERLYELVDWNGIRNSEALEFVVSGRKMVAWPKIQGDDWDLAIYLEALQRLSHEYPAVQITIELNPDGPKLLLENGSFLKDQQHVAEFLDKMKVPRPALEGQFHRLVLAVRSQGAEFRDQLEHELARYENHYQGAVFELASAGQGLVLEVALDGRIEQLLYVIRRLQSTWVVVDGQAQARNARGPACELQLQGTSPRTFTLEWLAEWAVLPNEFEVARTRGR